MSTVKTSNAPSAIQMPSPACGATGSMNSGSLWQGTHGWLFQIPWTCWHQMTDATNSQRRKSRKRRGGGHHPVRKSGLQSKGSDVSLSAANSHQPWKKHYSLLPRTKSLHDQEWHSRLPRAVKRHRKHAAWRENTTAKFGGTNKPNKHFPFWNWKWGKLSGKTETMKWNMGQHRPMNAIYSSHGRCQLQTHLASGPTLWTILHFSHFRAPLTK